MVSADLLERRDNPLDRRVKNIFLTKPSLKLLSDVHEAVVRVQHRLLEPLGPAEREIFIELLARIASENNELSRAPLRAVRKRQRKSTARSVEGG
jgi:DNA-binding MarR family transcriptional regulator